MLFVSRMGAGCRRYASECAPMALGLLTTRTPPSHLLSLRVTGQGSWNGSRAAFPTMVKGETALPITVPRVCQTGAKRA